jgi:hypothetical protein
MGRRSMNVLSLLLNLLRALLRSRTALAVETLALVVAGGQEKAKAVLAVLHEPVANVLITDESLAGDHFSRWGGVIPVDRKAEHHCAYGRPLHFPFRENNSIVKATTMPGSSCRSRYGADTTVENSEVS